MEVLAEVKHARSCWSLNGHIAGLGICLCVAHAIDACPDSMSQPLHDAPPPPHPPPTPTHPTPPNIAAFPSHRGTSDPSILFCSPLLCQHPPIIKYDLAPPPTERSPGHERSRPPLPLYLFPRWGHVKTIGLRHLRPFYSHSQGQTLTVDAFLLANTWGYVRRLTQLDWLDI